MQFRCSSIFLLLCGSVSWLINPSSVVATIQVVPGTASFVDLDTSVDVVVNGITAQGSAGMNELLFVGAQWPEPTFPPLGDTDAWSLGVSREVVDLDERSFAAAMARYEPTYNGLQTNLFLGASAEGYSSSDISPGDDTFVANGKINGSLDMYLTSNNAGDLPGPYDVKLDLTLTGDKLAATPLAAGATMNYFVRITPHGGLPIVFNNTFTDLALPLGGPPFSIHHSLDIFGVLLVPESATLIAELEFGVGLDDGLQTTVDGRTLAQPRVTFVEAGSMFDSTLAMNFTAQRVVPEPASFLLAILTLLGLLLLTRGGRK